MEFAVKPLNMRTKVEDQAKVVSRLLNSFDSELAHINYEIGELFCTKNAENNSNYKNESKNYLKANYDRTCHM